MLTFENIIESSSISTLFPRTALWKILTFFPILEPAPITAFLPMPLPSPIAADGSTEADSSIPFNSKAGEK